MSTGCSFPESHVKKHLLSQSDVYRQALSSLGELDKEAVTQRKEYQKMEDRFFEKASRILTTKETSAEDIFALLESSELKALEQKRQKINDIRSQTLRVATEAYNRVDDSINQLDQEISMLEPQIAASSATLQSQQQSANAHQQPFSKSSSKRKSSLTKKQQEKLKAAIVVQQKKQQQQQPPLLLPGQEILEELVDPNEPVYCICQRISFGQMVGCENEDCRLEWFHFECVGLTAQPTGKWYCPDCSAQGHGAPPAEESESGAASGSN